MGMSNSLAWMSLTLSLAVATVALVMGLRLLSERRNRTEDLSAADHKHFIIQDLRRGIGIILMAFLAVGVYAGSRLPEFVVEAPNADVDALAGADAALAVRDAHPNNVFLAVWLGVFASVVLLLGLALIDWISTRRYAQRHRREMNQQRLDILRETLRHVEPGHDGLGNGRPTGDY
jgi:hypothetical protein